MNQPEYTFPFWSQPLSRGFTSFIMLSCNKMSKGT